MSSERGQLELGSNVASADKFGVGHQAVRGGDGRSGPVARAQCRRSATSGHRIGNPGEAGPLLAQYGHSQRTCSTSRLIPSRSRWASASTRRRSMQEAAPPCHPVRTPRGARCAFAEGGGRLGHDRGQLDCGAWARGVGEGRGGEDTVLCRHFHLWRRLARAHGPPLLPIPGLPSPTRSSAPAPTTARRSTLAPSR